MLWVLTLLVADPCGSGSPQEQQRCCVYRSNRLWEDSDILDAAPICARGKLFHLHRHILNSEVFELL